MTRENKLALIIGFSLLLVVAVLLADHLSPAQQERLATLDARFDADPAINLPAGSGEEAMRQFARGDETPRSNNGVPQVSLIDPPIGAVQTELTIDEAINDASRFEGGDVSQRTQFGPIPPEEPATDPLVMGRPVTGPESTSSLPVSHGNAEAYTVKQRDTLYGLCKRFYGDGALYVKLAKFNEGIVPANGWIREGMTIWIPSRNALDGRADSTPARTPTKPQAQPPAKAVKTVNYTIKENDRLWDIAKDHLGKGTRWQEIVDLNKDVIKNPDVLPIGKTIRLPAR